MNLFPSSQFTRLLVVYLRERANERLNFTYLMHYFRSLCYSFSLHSILLNLSQFSLSLTLLLHCSCQGLILINLVPLIVINELTMWRIHLHCVQDRQLVVFITSLILEVSYKLRFQLLIVIRYQTLNFQPKIVCFNHNTFIIISFRIVKILQDNRRRSTSVLISI